MGLVWKRWFITENC